MKIQLLVYSGETFVQGLQLRKPGKRMKAEKTWQEKRRKGTHFKSTFMSM